MISAQQAQLYARHGFVVVDNIFDARYFVYHPYPGRTFYVEAKLRM